MSQDDEPKPKSQRATTKIAKQSDEIASELQALKAAYPLRERFAEQLMISLYRAGRQAEALQVYDDTRRSLHQELGVEPGRGLRDLQHAVLNHDPSLTVDQPPGLPRNRHGRRGLVASGIVAIVVVVVVVAVVIGTRGGSTESSILPPAGSSLVRIDAGTGEVTGAVQAKERPLSVAAANGFVWVLTSRGQLEQIDPGSNKVVRTVNPVGPEPAEWVVADDSGLWLGEDGDGTPKQRVVRYDPRRRVQSIAPTGGLIALGGVANADGIWVATYDHVLRLDPVSGEVVARVGCMWCSLAAGDGHVWALHASPQGADSTEIERINPDPLNSFR